MMSRKEDDIEYIFEHLAAPESLLNQEFCDWLAEDGHRLLFEEMRNQREAFLQREYESHIDLEEEYKRFKAKTGTARWIHRNWWMVAAGVCLLLSVALLVKRPDIEIEPLAGIALPSGKKSAKLILANGEQIALENRVIELRESNGTLITTDTNWQLSYQQDSTKTGNTTNGDLVYNILRVPAGADYVVRLADGSRVRLNCGTEFRFPVEFAANERKVFLNGEAFFEVKKSVEWPFIVVTDKMDVKVTGTSFNVKSYQSEDIIHTTLVNGSVEVSTGERPGSGLHLSPSQQFYMDKRSGQMEVKMVDVEIYTGWTEGMFVFKNQRLEEVMDMLARWYPIEVFYTNTSVRDLRLSANLGRYEHIDSLLTIIRTIDRLNVVRKGNVVTISWK